MSRHIKNKSAANVIKEILFFILLTMIMMLPIYYLVITTFKTSADATNNPLSLPKVFQIEGYIKAWTSMEYPRAFSNSFIITVVSLTGVLLLSAMASYAIARKRNTLNKIIFTFFSCRDDGTLSNEYHGTI